MIDLRGVQAVIRKAMEIGEGDLVTTDADRAYIALRRALVFMIRNVANHGSTFEVLSFAREVTNPLFLRDPARGVARMTELSESPTATPVPGAVWAHASDVFDELMSARESSSNRPPTEDDIGSHARNVLQVITLADLPEIDRRLRQTVGALRNHDLPDYASDGFADSLNEMADTIAQLGGVRDRLDAIIRLAEGPPIAVDVRPEEVR